MGSENERGDELLLAALLRSHDHRAAMDDDFGVWDDAPSTFAAAPVQQTPPFEPPSEFDSFGGGAQDDFDDFGDGFASAAQQDDDFGDFGDFGEVQPSADEFPAAPAPLPTAGDWQALQLRPFPSSEELRDRIQQLIGPLFPNTVQLSNEPIRQAEGVNQVLLTPER